MQIDRFHMSQGEKIQSVGVQTGGQTILVEADEVGVSYVLGGKREDTKSRVRDFFLRRERREFWALRHVSFTAHAGEVLGVVGANGAGKTTLCRVLAGLLRPDAGKIALHGSVSALLSLGTGFNGRLSGRENIFLNGMMLGLSKREITERLPDILMFSGLEQFIDQPLEHYSHGMRSRLGFSIAAMMEPEILIVDETLSVGDLAFSEKAGEKIRELTRKAKLVVVVTHQLSFVYTYCTQALWIDQGVVKAVGDAHEVAQRYEASAPPPPQPRKIMDWPLLPPRKGTACVVSVRHAEVQFPLVRKEPSNNKSLRAWLPFGRRRTQTFRALKDVSFEVYGGDILGIIGPNGAGKTTLCRVLAGVLQADLGEVAIEGEITALLTFGAGFNDQLSGRDNVFLNGMMLGISKQELNALYPHIVEFSGLSRFMEQPLKHYSQGMRARLGFSIAAMIKPDVFIVDEALSVGDAAFAERAGAKIQELIAEANAVIVVSHNVELLKKFCTKALWLGEGKVRFMGDPAPIFEQYQQTVRKAVRQSIEQ